MSRKLAAHVQDERAERHATTAVPLVPYPGMPALAHAVRVPVRREPDAPALRYVLAADAAPLRLPPRRAPRRRDGLWRHTCFELFVSAEGGGYDEFNFAPSGEWAAYRFAGYRREGTALECAAPTIVSRVGKRRLELEAAVACARRGRVTLGLCAVLEDVQGRLSYWALRHPGMAPDFHRAEGFALELDEVRD